MIVSNTDGSGAIHAFVYRSRENAMRSYEVESTHPISVMSLMEELHQQDPTLACRTSMCFHGTCGSCLINVNGKDVKGCTRLVMPGETVYLRPHSGYRLIQDLVVDFSQPLSPES